MYSYLVCALISLLLDSRSLYFIVFDGSFRFIRNRISLSLVSCRGTDLECNVFLKVHIREYYTWIRWILEISSVEFFVSVVIHENYFEGKKFFYEKSVNKEILESNYFSKKWSEWQKKLVLAPIMMANNKKSNFLAKFYVQKCPN